jgi:hypothetical protein
MSTPAFPLPRDNEGEKEGYLKKQSDFFKNWNQRYCILKGNTIYYFKTDTVSIGSGRACSSGQSSPAWCTHRLLLFCVVNGTVSLVPR